MISHIAPVLFLLASTAFEARASSQTTLATAACSETALLRVSDRAPRQGSVLVVEVRSESPLASVEGFSGGDELHFWNDRESRVFQALLGVDLLARPGARSVRVRAFPEQGDPVECRVELHVVDGNFPVQKLSVAPKYVQLSKADAARAQRELRELLDIFRSATPERLWQGSFLAPVAGYDASGSFGKRRILNGRPRSPHSGEDFPAPAGTPIRATARGRVVIAKELFFLGNTVVLDHGFGLYSFYGHMSSIAVESGSLVERGTVIGKVGATGRVTGAHLHWGARLENKRVNPLALLSLTR